MEFKSVNGEYGYAIRLERGEQVIADLETWAREEGIHGGFFSGIGAAQDVTLGYYDLSMKEYVFSEYPDPVEVLSFKGNISMKDNFPMIHAHVVVSDTKNQVFGGHLQEATVAGTLEIFLHLADGVGMKREFDNDTGLSLLNFH